MWKNMLTSSNVTGKKKISAQNVSDAHAMSFQQMIYFKWSSKFSSHFAIKISVNVPSDCLLVPPEMSEVVKITSANLNKITRKITAHQHKIFIHFLWLADLYNKCECKQVWVRTSSLVWLLFRQQCCVLLLLAVRLWFFNLFIVFRFW